MASLGHPCRLNFNGVSRLAFVTTETSLTEGQPNFARYLAVSWAGTLYKFLYIFGGSCPLTEFCPVQNSLCLKDLRWYRYCTALQQQASAKLCGVVQGMELENFRRKRHLYSAGRPSRWAPAHILVLSSFFPRVISPVADWMSFILPHMVWA